MRSMQSFILIDVHVGTTAACSLGWNRAEVDREDSEVIARPTNRAYGHGSFAHVHEESLHSRPSIYFFLRCALPLQSSRQIYLKWLNFLQNTGSFSYVRSILNQTHVPPLHYLLHLRQRTLQQWNFHTLAETSPMLLRAVDCVG